MSLEWAAGFFDGEGCVTNTTASHKYRYLSLSLTQVRREPLDRFAAAVGLGNVTGPYHHKNTKHNPRFQWVVSGRKAEQVWELIAPFVSIPTLEKYERAISTITERKYKL